MTIVGIGFFLLVKTVGIGFFLLVLLKVDEIGFPLLDWHGGAVALWVVRGCGFV